MIFKIYGGVRFVNSAWFSTQFKTYRSIVFLNKLASNGLGYSSCFDDKATFNPTCVCGVFLLFYSISKNFNDI